MKIKITAEDVKQHNELTSEAWCNRLVVREMERRTAFWAPISQRAEEAFCAIIKPTHKHPAKHLHEFPQPFDPANSPLEDWEHGCSEVREMKLSLSFEQVGHRRITIN